MNKKLIMSFPFYQDHFFYIVEARTFKIGYSGGSDPVQELVDYMNGLTFF